MTAGHVSSVYYKNGKLTSIAFQWDFLLPLCQLLFECFERILDLWIGKRDIPACIIGGKLESNIFGEMGEFDQVNQRLVRGDRVG